MRRSSIVITIVTPNLLVGPAPQDDDEYEQLKAARVTAVLSLQTVEDLGERTPEDVRSDAETAGFVFRNVPVNDFDLFELKRRLPQCVKVLDQLVVAGHRVYVHCTAGVTRSPTVIAAHLHWRLGWPVETALNYLHDLRDCCPQGDLIRRIEPVM